MNWPWKKKKLSFAETAKFNWEADTNEELRQKLNELAKQYPTLREGEYREKLLSLFRERGLDLNAEQLDRSAHRCAAVPKRERREAKGDMNTCETSPSYAARRGSFRRRHGGDRLRLSGLRCGLYAHRRPFGR